VILALIGIALGSAQAQDLKAVLASPHRLPSELALDGARKPQEVLNFYGVKPGYRVADLMAGGGYYTVILSLSVGDKGLVYSASPTVRKETKERLQGPVFGNIKLVEGPMDGVALPPDGSLDFVLIHLNYHDLSLETRTAMNRRVLAALKPGGGYGIVDHAAKDGSGNDVAKTLHRIDKALVVKEATEAGFALSREGDMLRNPSDERTESVFKDRGKSDRFVLRFEKPK
jgi:predicted methyltransferase